MILLCSAVLLKQRDFRLPLVKEPRRVHTLRKRTELKAEAESRSRGLEGNAAASESGGEKGEMCEHIEAYLTFSVRVQSF